MLRGIGWRILEIPRGEKNPPKNLICQKIRENWPGWVPVARGILERKNFKPTLTFYEKSECSIN